MIKDNLKSFFVFSKKELNGLLVFCCLFVIVIIAPLVYRWLYPPDVFSYTEFRNDIEKFRASAETESPNSYNRLKEEIEEKETEPQYFRFNPNHLSEESWRRLGLSNKQIKVIKNYEAKGGRFYDKEDVRKIYSISAEDYSRLESYIAIPEAPGKDKPVVSAKVSKSVTSAILIELNTADSIQLETIRGIGPAFASRIIKYRNRLGGFYKKEQLREVYGIDSVKYEQLKDQIIIDYLNLRKININTAAFDDLKRHPYLNFKQMNAIIQYRKQHGPYRTIADLKKVVLINAEVLSKIEPYLILND